LSLLSLGFAKAQPDLHVNWVPKLTTNRMGMELEAEIWEKLKKKIGGNKKMHTKI